MPVQCRGRGMKTARVQGQPSYRVRPYFKNTQTKIEKTNGLLQKGWRTMNRKTLTLIWKNPPQNTWNSNFNALPNQTNVFQCSRIINYSGSSSSLCHNYRNQPQTEASPHISTCTRQLVSASIHLWHQIPLSPVYISNVMQAMFSCLNPRKFNLLN